MTQPTQLNGHTGVIAVVTRSSLFLTIRRAATVRKPGKICFPGGGMLPGEPEEATVAREMREELGVGVRPIQRLAESFSPWGTRLLWWQCEFDGPPRFEINASEIAELMWLSKDQMLAHPDLLESNHWFLRRCLGGESMRPAEGPA